MEDIGSGGRCREVSESADAVDDQLGPAGSVAEVDDGAAGSSGEGRGDGVKPVAEPFRFPAAGFMTGQGQHRAPGLQLGGQGDDLAPDPILVEPVQREVGQACVFRDPDPVFAAGAEVLSNPVDEPSQAACWMAWSEGSGSTSLPSLKVAPARTLATRWGARIARHLFCADCISLNAIAIPAARLPGPFVTR